MVGVATRALLLCRVIGGGNFLFGKPSSPKLEETDNRFPGNRNGLRDGIQWRVTGHVSVDVSTRFLISYKEHIASKSIHTNQSLRILVSSSAHRLLTCFNL